MISLFPNYVPALVQAPSAGNTDTQAPSVLGRRYNGWSCSTARSAGC